jgi:predicted metal-dependent HD superfamily phosphohydrolase
MHTYNELLEKVSRHVIHLFTQYEKKDLCYHNLEHTKTVVERTLQIAAYYDFSAADQFILTTSAWFHDTGQLTGGPEGHEERSIDIMTAFLKANGVKETTIKRVEHCICSTMLSQVPHSLIEEILCDADTFNLGTKEFCKTDGLLKKECVLRNLSINQWEEKTLQLLLSHQYYTSYCQTLLNRGKEENIAYVRSQLLQLSVANSSS